MILLTPLLLFHGKEVSSMNWKKGEYLCMSAEQLITPIMSFKISYEIQGYYAYIIVQPQHTHQCFTAVVVCYNALNNYFSSIKSIINFVYDSEIIACTTLSLYIDNRFMYRISSQKCIKDTSNLNESNSVVCSFTKVRNPSVCGYCDYTVLWS